MMIFVITLSISNAQSTQSREKMESIKIAYITEKLTLTEKQSQTFWPIYNSYQKERRALRPYSKDKNEKPEANKENLEQKTDAEINALILSRFEAEEKMLALQKTYFEKYKTVLSMQQIAKLYKAERDFRKEVLERIKQRK